MAHFYGTVQGSKGEVSRLGGKQAGMRTTAASHSGAIRTTLFVNDKGEDCFRVEQSRWQGRGIDKVIAEGVIGK